MAKIAVYTIALNEEQFVQKWYDSAKEADYLLIADTGSQDGTVELAKTLGINVMSVSIKPWRFDDARNASLAAIPTDVDYCIALDMDEVLLPNWREELEKAFKQGATRPRYQYTWSWKDEANGVPGLQYGGDKIHARQGYRWRHPVHEVLTTYGPTVEKQVWVGLEIHHHPDSSKPRSQYLPLLAQAIKEDETDDRNAFYYARELYFYKNYEESAKEFKRHLSLPKAVWRPERASSMRYLAKIEPLHRESWLIKAHMESPERREALVELAQHLYENGSWTQCNYFAKKALTIEEKPLDYLCEEFAWGETPWDLAAISSFYLGEFKEAHSYGLRAAELAPNSERIAKNLEFYAKAVS